MGNDHSYVYAWGKNDTHQIGMKETEKDFKVPVGIEIFKEPVPVLSAGCTHSAAIMIVENKRVLYVFGQGYYGQLGNNSRESCEHPTPLTFFDNLPQLNSVCCGKKHTLALLENGDVYSWGFGQDGQLGHGDLSESLVPKRIESLCGLGVCEISAGAFHSAARTKGLRGKVITQIACGATHTLVLTNNGEVYSWGIGDEGQLGHGERKNCTEPKLIAQTEKTKVRTIACGNAISAYFNTRWELYVFGNGSLGQIGNGENSSVSKPTLVSGLNNETITQISCGDSHIAVVNQSGEVFCWGNGVHGQLGNGHTKNLSKPLKVTKLKDAKISQVVCGTDFTFALISEKFGLPRFIPPPNLPQRQVQDPLNQQNDPNLNQNSNQNPNQNGNVNVNLNQNQNKISEQDLEKFARLKVPITDAVFGIGISKEDFGVKIEKPPEAYLCPLSHKVMDDPVFCADGFTYDRESIEKWLSMNNISPITHHLLPNKDLLANNNLRAQIKSSKWANYGKDEF
ncbi:claret isoform a [Anaeramoeba ignava]|uniref:Claret isoform a n=1 Tax=Anaeramoeba ignava TaxID=1746090 RepID=A0A9Q0LIY5_ANAIG|nr:claret isoform a [Anaeramoeba ignava]